MSHVNFDEENFDGLQNFTFCFMLYGIAAEFCFIQARDMLSAENADLHEQL